MLLANLLPGLRDLRTPLAVGYVWLAVFWLIFESSVPAADEATGVVASIYRIGELVGAAASLAMLSFVAYLTGAILSQLSRFLSPTRLTRNFSGWRPIEEEVDLFVLQELQDLRRHDRFEAARYMDEMEVLARARIGVSMPGPSGEEVEVVAKSVLAELDSIVARLQVFDKEQLYQSYDRSVSEAEFRSGVALPLFWLVIILIVESRFWIPAVVMPVALLLQADRKKREAARIAHQAVVHRIIPSSTIRSLKEASLRPDTQ